MSSSGAVWDTFTEYSGTARGCIKVLLDKWYTTSLHTKYRLVGNTTPHFGDLCGDSGRSRAASLKESEQGKIALAEHVVSRAEPFKECNHNVA